MPAYTYDGPKGPTRRAYLDEPGWSTPPARPEPLPERCTRPLMSGTRTTYAPAPVHPGDPEVAA